jgi:hypothetical protein
VRGAASMATPRCNESKERAREVLQVSPVHLDIPTQTIFRVTKMRWVHFYTEKQGI